MDNFRRYVDLVVGLLVISIIGYVGESGRDGGFIKDIWTGLKTASPPVAMVMFYLYLRADNERRAESEQSRADKISFLNSMNEHTGVLEKLAEGLRSRRSRR